MGKKEVFQPDESVCTECGKIIYPNRRTAKRRAKMMQRPSAKGRRYASMGPMSAYPCPMKKGWHIGHRRPRTAPPPDVLTFDSDESEQADAPEDE